MYYWVIALLIVVGLMLLFWGSGQGPLGMRIVLFGMFTLHGERVRIWTRAEQRDFVRSEILRRERENRERENDEDGDDREDKKKDLSGYDLFDRLGGAGFVTLDEARGPRLADIGKIDYESTEKPCPCCNDGAIYLLFEIFAEPEQPGKVGSVGRNLLGNVCEYCGHRPQEGESTRPVGVIGPVIGDGVNFFDVLEYFRELRKPKTKPEAAAPEVVATAPLGTDQASEPDAAGPDGPDGYSAVV